MKLSPRSLPAPRDRIRDETASAASSLHATGRQARAAAPGIGNAEVELAGDNARRLECGIVPGLGLKRLGRETSVAATVSALTKDGGTGFRHQGRAHS